MTVRTCSRPPGTARETLSATTHGCRMLHATALDSVSARSRDAALPAPSTPQWPRRAGTPVPPTCPARGACRLCFCDAIPAAEGPKRLWPWPTCGHVSPESLRIAPTVPVATLATAVRVVSSQPSKPHEATLPAIHAALVEGLPVGMLAHLNWVVRRVVDTNGYVKAPAGKLFWQSASNRTHCRS